MPKTKTLFIENELTRERLKKLVRIYHSAHFAAEATGFPPNSLTRAARRLGLAFRRTEEIRASRT